MGTYPNIESWAKSRVAGLADADIDREADVFIVDLLQRFPCLGASYGAMSAANKTFFDKHVGLMIAAALYGSSAKQTPSGDLVAVKLNDKEFRFSDKGASSVPLPVQWQKDAKKALGSIACVKAAILAAGGSSFRVSGPTRTARENGERTSLTDDIGRLLDPTWGTE